MPPTLDRPILDPPILDPRDGDIEDDASSTKRRSMLSLAGTLLAEISLPKLVLTWMLLIGFPFLLLGAAPLLVSMWIVSVSSKAGSVLTELWPALLLGPLVALGWIGGRRLLRLAESSFWSLNALAVQPAYSMFREGLRHLADRLLPDIGEAGRARVRAGTAAAAGIAIFALGLGIIALAWPATRWTGSLADLSAPFRLLPFVAANSIVLVFAYFSVFALVWGLADTTMAQPRDLKTFANPSTAGRRWRVAHLSDIHTVGEPYGFRVESGRSGACGNGRFRQALVRLEEIHAVQKLDVILITGDLTDAGRSAEWAEFFGALATHPTLAGLVVALPGNHDVNVVDRASPARLELPGSPMKRLRQMRTLSALEALQGSRLRIVDAQAGRLGVSLTEALRPHAADMAAFADTGSSALSRSLTGLWERVFPLVLPPETDDGLGILALNSNAETHFSFTNALGLVSADQARALRIATEQYPHASWIIALHHHVIEYPQPAHALSERIGTALVNGSWFIRGLQRLAGRAILMHGHRHVDWIGQCGGLPILSAPSPVMDAADCAETYFYVHTMTIGPDSRLSLLEPERVAVAGNPAVRTAVMA